VLVAGFVGFWFADWFCLTVVGRQMSSKSAGTSLVPELFRFGVYKSSQGRMVRQFTFFAIVVIAAFGCLTLANGMLGTSAKAVRIGVPALIWAVSSWFAFRAVNIPKFADFLVSVESELEKVTWPTRHEVVQATIVVLVAMFSLGVFLFLIDLLWTWLFSFIGFTEYKS
jgi:preprotein translocase subunit SecE